MAQWNQSVRNQALNCKLRKRKGIKNESRCINRNGIGCGTFDVYFDPEKEDNLSFGLLGQGNTVNEAIEDFLSVWKIWKSYLLKKGKKFPDNLECVFKYDVPSFLAYYKGKLSLSGLGKLTGINPKQLNHYVTGVRKPSPKTVKWKNRCTNSAKN